MVKTLFKVSFCPKKIMVFIDAHCHLDHPQFGQDCQKVIRNTRESGTICISHGTGEKSNLRTLQLADGITVFAACGQDPFHVSENLEKHLDFLQKNQEKILAVGEIGLDQHYFTKEEMQRQVEVFEAQMLFAEKNRKPVVIHTRKAVEEVLEILPSYECTKVLHYFLEKRYAQKAVDRECFLSLPTVKSKDRTAILTSVPLDRILCETDSPYSWKSRNEPKNVKEVYEEMAKVVKKPLEEITQQVGENAEKVFRFKKE